MDDTFNQRLTENHSSISEPIARLVEAIRHDISIWFSAEMKKHTTKEEMKDIFALMDAFSDFSQELINNEENDYNQYRALKQWKQENIEGKE